MRSSSRRTSLRLLRRAGRPPSPGRGRGRWAGAGVRAALPGRGPGRVGVLGADAVPFAWWVALDELVSAARPGAALEAADDLGTTLRRIKSPAGQRLVRDAGRLGGGGRAAGRASDGGGAGRGGARDLRGRRRRDAD